MLEGDTIEVIADDYFTGCKGKIVKVGRGPYRTYYEVAIESKFLSTTHTVTLLAEEIRKVDAD